MYALRYQDIIRRNPSLWLIDEGGDNIHGGSKVDGECHGRPVLLQGFRVSSDTKKNPITPGQQWNAAHFAARRGQVGIMEMILDELIRHVQNIEEERVGKLCEQADQVTPPMSSTKKPRSDSKVAGLAPEIRAEVARRLGEANESYKDVAAWLKAESKAQGNYDAATLALVQERAYIMARTQGADVNALATLAGIIGDSAKLRLKEREVALTERRVVLLEKKAAQADAAEGIVKDGDLNEAETAQRLRSLFGMG